MKLRELLSGLKTRNTFGDIDVEILGLAYDSRAVSRGFLFIAVRGTRMDGNRCVPQAIAKGAVAVVSASPRIESVAMPWIEVEDERSALAVLAGNFYGHPTRKLHLVGITGTNGKTTTSYLVESPTSVPSGISSPGKVLKRLTRLRPGSWTYKLR